MIGEAANSGERTFEIPEKNLKDFKWALGLNQLGTELIGVWPRVKGAATAPQTEPWHVRIRSPFIILLLLFWIFLPQIWALVLVIDNLSLVIDNLMSSSVAFSGFIKIFFLWRYKGVMRPVIESARRDWLRPKSAWERKLMMSYAFTMRLVTLVDYAATAVSVIGFLVFPLLGIDLRPINNITDPGGDRHLLVQSYYPFDYAKSPYFELTQVLQYFGAVFTGLAVTVPENYFGALCIHASAQFEILGQQLERFVYSAPGSADAGGEPRYLSSLIRRIIDALDTSFTYVTLASMFSTSLLICIYSFQFLAIFGAGSEQVPLIQLVALLLIMITFMAHTLVDCAVGETLASRSTSLIDSIYKCHWYTLDGKRARDLIPMMILSRIQKPLTAGKILPLSLATYCSILKTSAGYISVLLAVNEG